MFKRQIAVLATAVTLYVAYIYGFSCVFDLDYTLIFYVLAVMSALAFYAFSADFYPKTEADKMQNPESGLKYIDDNAYTWASLGAILMLLLSITPLLVSIYLNQTDTYHISWIFQGLIYLAGYILQFVTIAIYKSCGPISISGGVWYNKLVQRAATSSTTIEDVMKIIDETNDIMSNKKRLETYSEARALLKDAIVEYLGPAASEHQITETTLLESDLEMDGFDFIELEEKVHDRLEMRYGKSLFCVQHYYGENDMLKRYIDLFQSYKARNVDFKNADNLFEYGMEALAIFKTFEGFVEMLAGAIHYMKKYR